MKVDLRWKLMLMEFPEEVVQWVIVDTYKALDKAKKLEEGNPFHIMQRVTKTGVYRIDVTKHDLADLAVGLIADRVLLAVIENEVPVEHYNKNVLVSSVDGEVLDVD